MTRPLSNDEQIALIKDWWNEYGKMIVIAVVIALLASFGWRYWQSWQQQNRLSASLLYQQMIGAEANGQGDSANKIADNLYSDYAHTPYAKLAELIIAANYVQVGQLETAKQKLLWVMQNTNNPPVRQIARLRAARVMIAQNQSQQAINLLQTVDDTAFMPAIWLTRGDAYVSVHSNSQAVQAYQQALTAIKDNETQVAMRHLIEMKLANLANTQ